MQLRISSSILFAFVTVLFACAEHNDETGFTGPVALEMDTLVSAEWLREHLDDPDLVVIDATVLVEMDASGNFSTTSGQANYEAGHIPSAVFADLLGDLTGGDNKAEFAAPSPEQFAAAMAALGVGDNSRVVLYDSNGLPWAARVWWMLRWIGFDRAALLDGGLAAWKAQQGALSTESMKRPARTLSVNLRPELIADQDEVRTSLDDDAISLVDAMPEIHYRGEWSMYAQPGHIPGAVSLPTGSLVGDDGLFKPDNELATLIDLDRNARTITYCGGGIAASTDAFMLTRLGFTDVAIYDASLQEWAADPDNPMDVVLEFEDDEE